MGSVPRPGGGAVLRVPYLTTRSIWYDEASSWQTASFPLSGTLDSLRLNVHPPLYYWVLKAWMAAFGESVLALRGLSVLFGLLTVAGMYLAASRCTVRGPLVPSARRVIPAHGGGSPGRRQRLSSQRRDRGQNVCARRGAYGLQRLGSVGVVGGSILAFAVDRLHRALHGDGLHPPPLLICSCQ